MDKDKAKKEGTRAAKKVAKKVKKETASKAPKPPKPPKALKAPIKKATKVVKSKAKATADKKLNKKQTVEKDPKDPMYYPPLGFFFEVKILDKPKENATAKEIKEDEASAKTDASFQDVAGISVEIPTEELKEGGENRYAYRLPLPSKYPNLVLKRGLVSKNSKLGNWCRTTLDSGLTAEISTKNLLIRLLDEEKQTIMAWSIVDAYPVKWSVSNFNSMKNEIVVETIELVYKRFELTEDGN
ncbi:MAG: phage tail protein [Cytophagaceae bacterium]